MFPEDTSWPPRSRESFSGYPSFGRHARFRDEPEQPDPREATTEELGAEPVKNGPAAASHLAWCKKRALAEIPDTGNVISSLMQDLAEDPRTAGSVSIVRELMLPLAATGHLRNPMQLRKFVLDFR